MSEILQEWYRINRRDLPWRQTTDPYRIWLSEVILQQTRVAQGTDYYLRFTEHFPNVTALAEAQEEEVLKLWQGLGYYSRARNLLAAAREVAERFGGRFPDSYEAIRSLKGVGDYTAAAVASLAFRLPYAVVDGNVYRVLSRLYDCDLPIDCGAGKRFFAGLAQTLLDHEHPDLHNQAVMEFGALHCLPKSPRCESCPLENLCLARANGTIGERPVKNGAAAATPRYFNYLRIRCGENTLLYQRTTKDIWRGLYEFPLIETAGPIGDFETLRRTEAFGRLMAEAGETVLRRVVPMPRHQLSHRTIHAVFYELEVEKLPEAPRLEPISLQALGEYPVSRLTERYLEQISGAGL